MIVCPHCQQSFELDDALEATFRAHMSEEMEKQLSRRLEARVAEERKAAEEAATAKVRGELSFELTRLTEANRLKDEQAKKLILEQEQRKAQLEDRERQFQVQLENARKSAVESESLRLQNEFEEKARLLKAQNDAAVKKLDEYARREAELEARQKAMDAEVNRKLQSRLEEEKAAELLRFKEEQKRLEKELADRFASQLDLLKQQAAEREQRVTEMRERELQLEAEKRRLREQFEETEHRRKLAFEEEKAQAERMVRERMEADFTLKLQEKESLIETMRKNAETLQKQARQGLARNQGEAQEEFLKRRMQEQFPSDRVEDIKTGKLGADLKWYVYSESRAQAGLVLIESKNAENFSNSWVEKLKQDREREAADVAVLVTQAFPAGMEHFGQRDGIWVCAPHELVPMLEVLRVALIDIAKTRASVQGAETKAGQLYEYLTSTEFTQRVSMVLDTFRQLRDQLEKERIAFEKQWAERERLLNNGRRSLAAAFGQMSGIAGSDLPAVEQFQLGD
jgi:hypothetical protein